jgi:hypothetical protein
MKKKHKENLLEKCMNKKKIIVEMIKLKKEKEN